MKMEVCFVSLLLFHLYSMQREALLIKPAVHITQLPNAREKISHITQAQFGSLAACNAQAGGVAGLEKEEI